MNIYPMGGPSVDFFDCPYRENGSYLSANTGIQKFFFAAEKRSSMIPHTYV